MSRDTTLRAIAACRTRQTHGRKRSFVPDASRNALGERWCPESQDIMAAVSESCALPRTGAAVFRPGGESGAVGHVVKLAENGFRRTSTELVIQSRKICAAFSIARLLVPHRTPAARRATFRIGRQQVQADQQRSCRRSDGKQGVASRRSNVRSFLVNG